MKEENNVLSLQDYINHKETVDQHQSFEPIQAVPKSELVARAMAFGIDTFIILLVNYAVHAAYALFVNQFLHPLNSQSKMLFFDTQIGLSLSIFLILFGSYFVYTGVVLGGKTIGKMVFKLSVINENFVVNHLENTHQVTIKQSVQRAIGYLTCYLSFGTFFIFHLASEDNRGISDYLSGTRTVSDEWLAKMLEHKAYAAEEVTIDIRSLDKAA